MDTSPEKWVELYGDVLYSYAFSRLNDKSMAFDLVQETFLAALSSLKSFEGRSTEKTWLISILKRKIVDQYRRETRNKEDKLIDRNYNQGKESRPFQADGVTKGHWSDERVPKDWQYSPDTVMENKELREVIERCIALLPKKWAAVFVLRVIEEIKTDEVCKELDISASNFWVIMHRAKIQLRECVERNWLNS